jgi:HlyD family secretion protein
MSLQGKGVLSDEAMQARMFKVEAARSAAQAQQAQLQDLEVRRAHLVIRAPVSGLVLERNVRLGDMSAPSAPPMFRIARDSQIELMAQAPESDLYRINVGDPVDVTLADGAHVQGRVRLISDRIDLQTKLGSVRVALSLPDDNSGLRGRWTAKAGLRGRIGGPDAQIANAVLEAPPEQSAKTPTLRPLLRVGAFATASFNGVTTDAPSVPEAAVRYDTDGASVMAVQPDNRVRKVQVKTGARGDGYVQLLQGPPPGTEVLLGAAAFVVDGEAVQPIRTAAN